MNSHELLTFAKEIPTMTDIETRELIRQYAARVHQSCAIVEVGVWLGACTAFAALGVLDSKKEIAIHVFDKFRATQSEIGKAEKWGVIFYSQEPTTGAFDNYTKPFGVKIIKHVGNIKKSKWYSQKIGLYIDDASKREEYFIHSMKTFARRFIPGTILFLLDYFYYEKKPDRVEMYSAQKKWMEKHTANFRFLYRTGPVGAVFQYIGGLRNELSQLRGKNTKPRRRRKKRR